MFFSHTKCSEDSNKWRKRLRKTRLWFSLKVGVPTVRGRRRSSNRSMMLQRLFMSACCPRIFRSSDLSANRLDEREDGSAIQNYLLEKTGQRTVPNIFISRRFYILSRCMVLTC
jgi:glutaredoxin